MDDETVDTQTTLPALTLGSRWAIEPDAMARIIETQRRPASADTLRMLARVAAKPQAARRTTSQRAGGAVAVLPLTGVLTPRGGLLSLLFGGGYGGLADFREAFRDAVQSPDVGAIVLDVDSPGGLVDLVPETAAEIREARGTKPIVAVANTFSASGAYWIAAQADEVVVTPSGDVGSIGVYRVHEDWSAFNERAGIAVTYVHAGKYKVEGNPDEPLTEDAASDWQQAVDDIYGMFVDDVAAGRNVTAETVRTDYGEGRTMNAQRAVQAGMADRVATLEAVIGELLVPSASGANAAAAGRSARLVAAPQRAENEPSPVENDPTHVPDDAPPVEPPADPVEPDVGPDADQPEELGDEDRAAIAAVLID